MYTVYRYYFGFYNYRIQSGRTIPVEGGRRAQSEFTIGHGRTTERDRIVSGNNFVVSLITATQQRAKRHHARTVQSTVEGPSTSARGHHMYGYV